MDQWMRSNGNVAPGSGVRGLQCFRPPIWGGQHVLFDWGGRCLYLPHSLAHGNNMFHGPVGRCRPPHRVARWQKFPPPQWLGMRDWEWGTDGCVMDAKRMLHACFL